MQHQFQILRQRIRNAAGVTQQMLENVWRAIDNRFDILLVTGCARVEVFIGCFSISYA
jgi:hypothetical protein